MSGKGGYKHRAKRLARRKERRILRAKECIRRVRNQFESNGQSWEPENNPAQMSALTHAARRLVTRSKYLAH